jgi:hypothetical protein
MRRVEATIGVQTAASGRPRQVEWGERTLRVKRMVECWVYQTRWWGEGPGERRVYYRLQTECGLVEVYRTNGREWTLSRVAD